jgi:ABC-type sugar transport system substrate-binding protein
MIRKLIISCFVVFIAGFSFAAPKEVYYIVAHGGITNPFWQRTLKGAENAGKELGVEVHFLAPQANTIVYYNAWDDDVHPRFNVTSYRRLGRNLQVE